MWCHAAFRGLAISVLLVTAAAAQQRHEYQLIVPDSDIVSRASRTERRLEITDDDGTVTVYVRVRNYDSDDGKYLGYYSDTTEQVIRWPVSDRGSMLIATFLPDGLSRFKRSRMEIHPDRPSSESFGEPTIDPRASYRMTTTVNKDRGFLLEALVDSRVVMRRKADVDSQLWHLVPVGNGFYRLHSQVRGPKWSLSSRPFDEPTLEVTDDSTNQLWRITSSPSEPGALIVRAVAERSRERALTSTPGGRVVVEPFNNDPDQHWIIEAVEVALPPVFEEYAFLSHEVQPAEALPPAEIELVNSHRKELWVLIADAFDPSQSMRVIIPPGESKIVKLERDPGGELVEVYENHLAGGIIEREQFVTTLPPAPRYDVSVYEVVAQSVAIDRTVPGGRIEDVNYSPSSVGWFDLPSGSDVVNGTIDVYERATAMDNPGAARRIDPKLWQHKEEPTDPVESALEQFRPRRPR
jgi:hypothetical protein